jgi:hypothetical protein
MLEEINGRKNNTLSVRQHNEEEDMKKTIETPER